MSPPLPIRNAALAASAGTGKTFALSNRYLALLAVGADPASIVALTFTRKAAGEILSRILTRLARAAASDAGNLALSEELADAHLPAFATHAAAQTALRRLVQALPQLRIGTLDSFFLQVLTPFRLEVGIGAPLSIVQPLENPEDDLVLQNLLERASLSIDEQRELMETFRLATFGEEKKSIYDSIQRLIQNQFERFQRAPDPEVWGAPSRIWNGDDSLLQPPPVPNWTEVFSVLATQAEALRTDSSRKAWETFIAHLQNAQNGNDYEFGPVLNHRLYTAFTSAEGDRTSIPFGRSSIALLPETQIALAAVFTYLRHVLLARQIVRTRGLYRLLAAYGREHRDHIVRTGQLAFNDIAQLLAPASGLAPAHLRSQLDGRLDARFLHWLLDEFQDTSLLQWAVIENLIDEVIQNPDGDRTLFYVGDTKQAIYEWRSGDPRLFRRILDKYNRPGHDSAIEVAPPLVKSWRSSPVILDAVNTVFGDLPGMALPGHEKHAGDWLSISEQWAAEWTPHEAADKNLDLSGHVALHVLPRPKKDDDDAPTPISRAADLVEQLQSEISDFEDRSIAILTRGNPDGLAMQGELAERGIHSVWAGDTELLDNTLIPAILSFAKLIEHPGDTFARHHVEMSKLVPTLSLAPADLSAWARLIREQGYAGFAAQLATRLDLTQAPLEQSRLRTLISLAAEFDRQTEVNALQFVSFIQAQKIASEQSGSNIQILTMHKAKGLEFDIVLLPAMGRDGITSKGKGPLLQHEQETPEPNPPVKWILTSPETEVIESEPPLAAQLAADRQGKALEELRLLYVAMTRAKRALYLISVEPAKKSGTLRLDNVVQQTLSPGTPSNLDGPVWERGDSRWWQKKTGAESPAEAPSASLDLASLPKAPAAPTLESYIASQEHAIGGSQAGGLFRPESAEARERGTRVHELFEQIEWLVPGQMPKFAEADPVDDRLVADFLKNECAHRLLEGPAGIVELMREQAFEAILDGKWLSGKIDRLHLERNADGKPIRAHVIDFKTDQIPNADRHRSQMEDYRKAVAKLFALDAAHITCTLLFVRSGDVVDL